MVAPASCPSWDAAIIIIFIFFRYVKILKWERSYDQKKKKKRHILLRCDTICGKISDCHAGLGFGIRLGSVSTEACWNTLQGKLQCKEIHDLQTVLYNSGLIILYFRIKSITHTHTYTALYITSMYYLEMSLPEKEAWAL